MEIEVGKTYRSDDGGEYTITSERDPNVFSDGLGHTWSKDGKFYSCYEEGNPLHDLVSVVPTPAQQHIER